MCRSIAEASGEGAIGWSWLPDRLWWGVGIVGAGLIPLYLLILILQGTPMQFNDYFPMVTDLFSPDGQFNPMGLLIHRNEHLIAIPKLIYLANIEFFGGSNITLGLFVWLVSLATAMLLIIRFSDLLRSRLSTQVVVVWIIIVYVFPLRAQANYLSGMSGTAWILANLFALSAIIAAVHRHSLTSAFFGVLGVFTYGTGIAIWPALVLILLLQRRFRPRDAVMLLAGALAIAAERLTQGDVYYHPPFVWDPIELLRSVVIIAGSLFSEGIDLALVIGTVTIGLFGILVHRLKRQWREPATSILLGLGAFIIGSFLMFALSRTGMGDVVFMSSRYMGIISLYALTLTLLALVGFGESIFWRWWALCMAILSIVVAVPTIHTWQVFVQQQSVVAIGARLGVGEGLVPFYGPASGKTLESLNHYPFNDLFDSDCGLLGQRVSPLELPEALTEPKASMVRGYLESVADSANAGASTVTGWVYALKPIECILLVDLANIVVGAAIPGITREDARSAMRASRSDLGWSGIVLKKDADHIRAVVRLRSSPDFFELGNAIPPK